MRYADGPSTEVTTVVDASVERVWALVTDLDVPARFSSEFLGGAWVDAPGEGARFTGRNEHPATGAWQTTCRVTRFEPHRAFEFVVLNGDDEPSATWRFTLTRRDDGKVELAQSMRMGPGRSGLNPAIDAMPDKEERIIARRLGEHQANMQRTVDGIRDLAEGSS